MLGWGNLSQNITAEKRRLTQQASLLKSSLMPEEEPFLVDLEIPSQAPALDQSKILKQKPHDTFYCEDQLKWHQTKNKLLSSPEVFPSRTFKDQIQLIYAPIAPACIFSHGMQCVCVCVLLSLNKKVNRIMVLKRMSSYAALRYLLLPLMALMLAIQTLVVQHNFWFL